MRRLWQAPGVMVAVAGMTAIMVSTARQTGVNSPHFWWSLLICLVVLAGALTFRYLTDHSSGSSGQRRSNQQPCG